MADHYNVRVELSRGDHRKAGNLVVRDDVIEDMAVMGLDALQEAVSEVVRRMAISIEEDETNGKEE